MPENSSDWSESSYSPYLLTHETFTYKACILYKHSLWSPDSRGLGYKVRAWESIYRKPLLHSCGTPEIASSYTTPASLAED